MIEIFIPDPDFFSSRIWIPDPGVIKALIPDMQHNVL
jgi:hypothetical protein